MPESLQQYLSLHDFEAVARKRLPAPLYAYVPGAVEDAVSVTLNRTAFQRYGFIPNCRALSTPCQTPWS